MSLYTPEELAQFKQILAPPTPTVLEDDGLFEPQAPAEKIPAEVVPADEDASSEAGKDSEVVPAYEGFRAVALRAAARHQRVLPILVGAKNPSIKWAGSPIDTASWQEWSQLSPAWIDLQARKFPGAAVAVIAKPDEDLFLDEDESKRFREGFVSWSGLPFPRTFTTESRPDHRQSHWLQTEKTRKLGNVTQGQLGFLSVRQNNYYVLSEGSPHPKGGFYRIVDDTKAIPMPDKLVEYIRHLQKEQAIREGKEIKAEFDKGNSKVGKPEPIPVDKLEYELKRYGLKLREKGFDQDMLANALAEIALVRAGVDCDCDAIAAELSKNPVINSIFDITKRIPHGTHNTTLFQTASMLRGFGAEIDTMIEVLETICQDRCDNVGEDGESMVRKCAISAHKYKPAPDYTLLIGGRVVGSLCDTGEPDEDVSVGVVTGIRTFDNRADFEAWGKDLILKADKDVQARLAIKAAETVESMIARGDYSYLLKGDFSDGGKSWIIKNIPRAFELPDIPPNWLIEEMIYGSGLHVFSGKMGSLKSLLMLMLVKSLCLGESFMNRQAGKPVTIVYIDRENPLAEQRKRCAALGILGLPNFHLWGDWLMADGQEPPTGFDDPRLTETVKRHDVFFMFDSLSSFLNGADENSSSEMMPIMQSARKLARISEGVAILHHCSKTGTGARGSTVISVTADMAFNVEKMTEDRDKATVKISAERFRMTSKYTMEFEMDFGGISGIYTYRCVRNGLYGKRSIKPGGLEPWEKARIDQQSGDNELIQRAVEVISQEYDKGKPINQSKLATMIGIKANKVKTRLLTGDPDMPWKCVTEGLALLFIPKRKRVA